MYSQEDQELLLDKLQVFKIQGRDKHGRSVLRVIGKNFPGVDKIYTECSFDSFAC